MFSAFRNALYFSKVNVATTEAFGIDLRMLDRACNGKIIECCNVARTDKRSPEEAAVLCLALTMHAFAHSGRFQAGDRPDYLKLGRHAVIVDGWAALGKVSTEIRDLFVEAMEQSIQAVENV